MKEKKKRALIQVSCSLSSTIFLYTVYDILSLAEVFLVIISLCTNLYFQFFPSRSADYSVISQTENRTKKPK